MTEKNLTRKISAAKPASALKARLIIKTYARKEAFWLPAAAFVFFPQRFVHGADT
jgi:hypothetical protein